MPCCYATKGMYRFPAVKSLREKNITDYNSDPKEWVFEMIKTLKNAKYFRWFDSGDIQDAEMFDYILKIACSLPLCKFWLPTREIGILTDYFRQGGTLPENLNVRISADFVDQEPTKKQYFKNMAVPSPPSTLLIHPLRCTVDALLQWKHDETEGKCGDCRACFDKSIESISYLKH